MDELMEEPKPKPARKWRTFLLEFGTIVLGVSVALAGQQAMEWWNWRSQVSEARTLIASELARSVAQAMWRMRTEKCGESRLDELGTILDTASKTGTLPPVGDIGSPPSGLWVSGAWQSAMASQAAMHFPREELVVLTTIYELIRNMDENSNAERTHWNALYTMVGPGRRLDPASEADLRKALSQARYASRRINIISGNLIRGVQTLNLPFNSIDLEAIAQGESAPLDKSRNEYSRLGWICSPIETVPAVYGQAMYKFVPYGEDETLKRYKFPTPAPKSTQADANKSRSFFWDR